MKRLFAALALITMAGCSRPSSEPVKSSAHGVVQAGQGAMAVSGAVKR